MRKALKKATAVLVCTCMVIVMAGCGKEKKQTEDAKQTEVTKDDNTTLSGEFPMVKEPITLKVMAAQSAQVEDLKTNEFTKMLEEKTGIKIEWSSVPESNASEKFNVIMSTGEDLPDVFIGFNINMAQQKLLGEEQGMFVNINPYLEDYGKNILKYFEKLPLLESFSRTPSGGLYGLSAVEESYHVKYPMKAWISKSYLENLKMDFPENTKEFKELLSAIKEKDPNGNGKNDEVPFAGAATGWSTSVVPYIMSAFIDYYEVPGVGNTTASGVTNAIAFTVTDGKIDTAFDKEGWKEGLKYLNELVEEGLLDPTSFTQDVQQLRTLTGNSANNAGVFTAGAVSAAVTSGDKYKDYVAMKPLAGPDGHKYTCYSPALAGFGKYAITKNCKNVAAAVRLADYLVSEEGTLNMFVGKEDRDWEYIEDDSVLGLNGEPARYRSLTSWGTQQNACWLKMGPYFFPDKLRNGVEPKDELEVMLYQETKEKYEPFNNSKYLLPVTILDEDMTEYVDIVTPLANYLAQMTAQFATGASDIDKEWDGYIDTLDSMQADKLTDMMNKAYELQYGSEGLK